MERVHVYPLRNFRGQMEGGLERTGVLSRTSQIILCIGSFSANRQGQPGFDVQTKEDRESGHFHMHK